MLAPPTRAAWECLRPLARGEQGQGATEFIILFPIILLFICSVLQLALIFVARSNVDYAAFCAARTAVVWYHEHEDGKDRRGPEAALRMAHRAAALANVAVSPKPPQSHSSEFECEDQVVTYLRLLQLTPVLGKKSKSWAERYKMSRAATDVSFVQGNDVQPGEPLTVRVVYWYRLYFPLVNRILGYRVRTTENSVTNGVRFTKTGQGTEKTKGEMPGFYLPITASCTMDVE